MPLYSFTELAHRMLDLTAERAAKLAQKMLGKG